MPYLSQIVDYINEGLKSGPLKRKSFQEGKFYGLAQSIAKYSGDKQSAEPVIYTDGKEIQCFVDDTYSFQIYHRAQSIASAYAAQNQFGDGRRDLTETVNMIAVVFADAERLSVSQADLAYLILSGLSFEIKNSDLGNTNLKSITITPQTANLNSPSVFQGEYQLAEYPLKPQSIYFAVNYQIETLSDKNCLACRDC